ncbi:MULTISPECIES: hypothetical protein [Arthrobacter]|uniref:Uncharacterized protein n=1 Tax=Arthrobacter methylotrophus TaxID=121291 RepID=A0ABV5UKB4_9MICC|nr:hypothetical protein [Arthrobacter sp. MA-N2]
MPLETGGATATVSHTTQPSPVRVPRVRRVDEFVRVIPGVDLSQGSITFVVDGHLERHWHHEPRLITEALSQAVQPARWFPATRKLTLTVAATGHRAGVQRHFILSAF